MPKYKVSLHNGADPMTFDDAIGPYDAAHMWVKEFKPNDSCDIKIKGNGDGEALMLRLNVNITYDYELTKEN